MRMSHKLTLPVKVIPASDLYQNVVTGPLERGDSIFEIKKISLSINNFFLYSENEVGNHKFS